MKSLVAHSPAIQNKCDWIYAVMDLSSFAGSHVPGMLMQPTPMGETLKFGCAKFARFPLANPFSVDFSYGQNPRSEQVERAMADRCGVPLRGGRAARFRLRRRKPRAESTA